MTPILLSRESGLPLFEPPGVRLVQSIERHLGS